VCQRHSPARQLARSHGRPRWQYQRLPAGDGSGALACMGVVGDAGEMPAQLNRSGELTAPVEGGPDRRGLGFGDDEHHRSMGALAAPDKLALHSERREECLGLHPCRTALKMTLRVVIGWLSVPEYGSRASHMGGCVRGESVDKPGLTRLHDGGDHRRFGTVAGGGGAVGDPGRRGIKAQICALIRFPIAPAIQVRQLHGHHSPLAFRQVPPAQIRADDEGYRIGASYASFCRRAHPLGAIVFITIHPLSGTHTGRVRAHHGCVTGPSASRTPRQRYRSATGALHRTSRAESGSSYTIAPRCRRGRSLRREQRDYCSDPLALVPIKWPSRKRKGPPPRSDPTSRPGLWRVSRAAGSIVAPPAKRAVSDFPCRFGACKG
jgi:hypothetical protein